MRRRRLVGDTEDNFSNGISDLVAHASEDTDKSGDGVLPESLFLFNSTMKLGRFLVVCLGWRAFLL